MEKIIFSGLESNYRDYLCTLQNGDETKGVPIYLKKEEKVFFVSDFILNDVKTFEKTAPQGLYRGGGVLDLVVEQGHVVIFDERKKWFRPVGGIARFYEGTNLVSTAIREFIEEIAVLTDNEETRLVPENHSKMVGKSIHNWGITVPSIRESGTIKVVHGFFNDVNKAFELLIRWDISEEKNLLILHSEDWFKGGQTGFIPFVLNNNGHLVGLFDGRHGFINFPITNFHPTLLQILNR